jgi:hypothetical protein
MIEDMFLGVTHDEYMFLGAVLVIETMFSALLR